MTISKEKIAGLKESLEPTLKKFPERKAHFETPSNIPLPPIDTPEFEDPAYLDQVGFPGEFPFTRGIQPGMYRTRLWTMRQYAGYATAEAVQPALPLPARSGPDRPLGCL